MKVLHVVGGLNVGGAENFLVNLLKHTSKEKANIHFLCYGNPTEFDYSAEVLRLGGTIHFIDKPAMLNPRKHIEDIKVFNATEGPFDIVHIHTFLQSSIVAYAFKKFSNSKIVVHSHSSQDNSQEAGVIRKAYETIARNVINRYSDLNLACSTMAGDYLFKKDYLIINNGVDVDFNQSVPPTNLNSSRFKIIQVGRLVDVKNHIFSIELMKRLKEEGLSFDFYIIGEGPNSMLIKDSVEQNKLSDCVHLMGLRHDVVSIMSDADILIMPSIYEGLPITLLESQSVGLKAVVSSSVDQISDLGLNLIDFKDLNQINTWVTAIREFSMDPSRSDLNEIKKRFYDEKFDIVSVSEQIYRYYDDLIN